MFDVFLALRNMFKKNMRLTEEMITSQTSEPLQNCIDMARPTDVIIRL